MLQRWKTRYRDLFAWVECCRKQKCFFVQINIITSWCELLVSVWAHVCDHWSSYLESYFKLQVGSLLHEMALYLPSMCLQKSELAFSSSSTFWPHVPLGASLKWPNGDVAPRCLWWEGCRQQRCSHSVCTQTGPFKAFSSHHGLKLHSSHRPYSNRLVMRIKPDALRISGGSSIRDVCWCFPARRVKPCIVSS